MLTAYNPNDDIKRSVNVMFTMAPISVEIKINLVCFILKNIAPCKAVRAENKAENNIIGRYLDDEWKAVGVLISIIQVEKGIKYKIRISSIKKKVVNTLEKKK